MNRSHQYIANAVDAVNTVNAVNQPTVQQPVVHQDQPAPAGGNGAPDGNHREADVDDLPAYDAIPVLDLSPVSDHQAAGSSGSSPHVVDVSDDPYTSNTEVAPTSNPNQPPPGRSSNANANDSAPPGYQLLPEVGEMSHATPSSEVMGHAIHGQDSVSVVMNAIPMRSNVPSSTDSRPSPSGTNKPDAPSAGGAPGSLRVGISTSRLNPTLQTPSSKVSSTPSLSRPVARPNNPSHFHSSAQGAESFYRNTGSHSSSFYQSHHGLVPSVEQQAGKAPQAIFNLPKHRLPLPMHNTPP